MVLPGTSGSRASMPRVRARARARVRLGLGLVALNVTKVRSFSDHRA